MYNDLTHHIQETALVDTHEHLRKEPDWVDEGPDILQDLFGNYVPADLHTAGASPAAMKRLMDGSDADVAGRFEGIREAWEATQFTGYGEAVRLIARHVYGIDVLTADAITSAQERIHALRRPGERLRLNEGRSIRPGNSAPSRPAWRTHWTRSTKAGAYAPATG